MSKTQLSFDETNMFIEVFKLGSRYNARDEVLMLMRLLRHLQPGLTDLVVVQAWQMMQAGQMKTARRMLEELDGANPGLPSVKAALAAVLFFSNESLWQAYANEVRALPHDDDALKIVGALEASAEMQADPNISRMMFGIARRFSPAEAVAA